MSVFTVFSWLSVFFVWNHFLSAECTSVSGEVYLLYTVSTDCETSLKTLAVTGDCFVTSNCSYSGISVNVYDGGVCGITTFGKLNALNARSYDRLEFYFDTSINANSSYYRLISECESSSLVTLDTIASIQENCEARLSLPYVTGLINVSMQD